MLDNIAMSTLAHLLFATFGDGIGIGPTLFPSTPDEPDAGDACPRTRAALADAMEQNFR